MISIRHYLHANPELSLEEFNTSELVASKLTEWGYQVTRGLGKTGVVGSLSKGDSPRTIGLRADMDALPIEETTGLPWASTAPGKMHACGHDGHTTILLAAAKYIASPACQFNVRRFSDDSRFIRVMSHISVIWILSNVYVLKKHPVSI